MNFDVFISYPHQDKAIADAACAALEAGGIRCWIAPRDVAPGTEWAAAIIDAIDRCRVMVLIFSSNSNESKQIYREVHQAFDREVPVVPLRIENVAPSASLSYYMGPVHWLDALTPPLDAHLKQLGDAVRALLQTRDPDQARSEPRKPQPEKPRPAPARRLTFPWLFAAAAGGAAAAAAAAIWLMSTAGFLPVPAAPPASPSAAIEGAFKGTMECDKLPWTGARLHVAVTLSIHAGNATFSREVYSGDGKRNIGVESGNGTLGADGVLELKTSWVSPTSRFDGIYAGRMTAASGSLAGKQILLVDGARHERPCSIVVRKVGDA